MRYVGCPSCRVRYPADRLQRDFTDRAAGGKTYTVLCSVCGTRFDVTFRRRRLLPMRVRVRSVP